MVHDFEEEEALVTALRNTFLPRLLDRDASVFATLVRDLWPEVDVPMQFAGSHKFSKSEEGGLNSKHSSMTLSKGSSRHKSSGRIHSRSIRGKLDCLGYTTQSHVVQFSWSQ